MHEAGSAISSIPAEKVMERDLIGNQRNKILLSSQMRFLKSNSTL